MDFVDDNVMSQCSKVGHTHRDGIVPPILPLLHTVLLEFLLGPLTRDTESPPMLGWADTDDRKVNFRAPSPRSCRTLSHLSLSSCRGEWLGVSGVSVTCGEKKVQLHTGLWGLKIRKSAKIECGI